jgi:hypothetical protein
MGAKLDLSDDGKNIGWGRSRSGYWGRYLHLREEVSKRRWRDKRNEELHGLYCRWSNEGAREGCACDTYRGRNSDRWCVGKLAITAIWNPEKLTVTELRSLIVDMDQFN